MGRNLKKRKVEKDVIDPLIRKIKDNTKLNVALHILLIVSIALFLLFGLDLTAHTDVLTMTLLFCSILLFFPFLLPQSQAVRESFRRFVFNHELREYHFWLIVISAYISMNIYTHYNTGSWYINNSKILIVCIVGLFIARLSPAWWFCADYSNMDFYGYDQAHTRYVYWLNKFGYKTEELEFNQKKKKWVSGHKIPKWKVRIMLVISWFDGAFFPGREVD